MKLKPVTLFIAAFITMTLACSFSDILPTAYPTYTPYPTHTREPQPTSLPTYTSYPTYTAYPTYTPYPTYTVEAQSTPDFLFKLTTEKFTEAEDIEAACVQEFGRNWRTADWNDIVDYYQAVGSLETFVSALGLIKTSDYLLTNNGEFWFSEERQYFIELHIHNLPPGFFSHADVDDHYIDLGSWYGIEAKVLCHEWEIP
jgi:hypothetical protein